MCKYVNRRVVRGPHGVAPPRHAHGGGGGVKGWRGEGDQCAIFGR